MKSSEKFKPLIEEINSYKKEFINFDKDCDYEFIPAQHNPKENGYYVTIRCGLSGIYQMLNEWKDDEWMIKLTDDSYTIAYSRNKIELKYEFG